MSADLRQKLEVLAGEAIRTAGDTRCVNPDCAESRVEMTETAYTRLVARLHAIRDLLATHEEREGDVPHDGVMRTAVEIETMLHVNRHSELAYVETATLKRWSRRLRSHTALEAPDG